ncbi:LacI family transcriptional regulator [Pullulanibacillus pueri]|uniref:Catabolite control protein A n=1 Tax=Pullulanibacillus pueri TaxID=1437324 RepID=A0A8J2ZVU1_9BACL|nr:LacI family DNA-binding transcriptional regulator [Pullulanibacillus pueri]MBM7680915.1 LacI family transcriptional regulator [Pullulanibacillus pueri]GGH81318.1 LacI family transcriptional regulator [Pullulanibacillus pueri]
MVTIYDIAKKANVSPMTVSRVINNSSNIKDTTRQKVEAIIKELGYIPNSAARSLISKRTHIISLLITDITNPFFTRVARGAEDKAKQSGYQLLLSNSDENIDKETEYINMLLSTGVDGVLYAPMGDESKKNLRTLVKSNIPFVLIDRDIQGIQSDIVLGDSYEGARRLVEHLRDQGHKNIALINGPSNTSTARERQRGYEETLRLSNLPYKKKLMWEIQYKEDTADDVIEQLLSLPKNQRPTAIFAGNNFIAVNVIKALNKKGIQVPDDMAIVCFDDFEPISGFNPFLTVAAQSAYSYGYMGAQFLIERIEGTGPKENRRIVLPPEIIVRKSSLGYTFKGRK